MSAWDWFWTAIWLYCGLALALLFLGPAGAFGVLVIVLLAMRITRRRS